APRRRWPRVMLPAVSPSTLPGTTRRPCSMTRPCTGRTNCASPAPQRIIFGIGRFFSACSTISASAASSAAPLIMILARKKSPLGVSRRSSCSTAIPCFLAKPATACAGALAEGPTTSVSRISPLSSSLSICAARRLGVAKNLPSVAATRPRSLKPLRTPSAKALPSRPSGLGGSSSDSSSTSSVACTSGLHQRETQLLARRVIRLRHRTRERAHAGDVGGALGHGDGSDRVEKVEGMRALQDHFIRRQDAVRLDKALGFRFEAFEQIRQQIGIRQLEVVARLLYFVLMVDIAVAHAWRPDEVEHAFLSLQVHGQALQAVGDFAEDGLARESAYFLEVGELRDLHAVEPDFPAQAPGAERRRFPV